MKAILVVLACLHAVYSRSVTDPKPVFIAAGSEQNGLCSTVKCAAGHTCRLLAQPDCIQNCELLPKCVTDNLQALNDTSDCGANAERTSCGSACEPTCNQPNITVCTANCIPNVCRCKVGFVRDDAGNCIKPSHCSPIPLITCANMDCREGYKCEEVMVNCIRAPCPRSPARCVPINGTNNSSQNCTDNEVWNSCGNACEKTCATRGNQMCPMICMSPGACVCKPGYVRMNGGCIPALSCPQVDPTAGNSSCRTNETFTTCGSACEPSCSNPRPTICTEQCIVGCQCSSGFFRNTSGFCVVSTDCTEAPITSTCANVRCTATTECKMVKTMFCKKEPCPSRPQCVPRGFNTGSTSSPTTCDLHCDSGKVCKMTEVQCYVPPCNPIPECVDENPGGISCALVDCQSGYSCVEEPLPCLVAPCPTTAKCVLMGNASCETVKLKCAENHVCGMENGAPRCVFNGSSSCATTLCIPETHCVEETVQCFAPPCPTKAVCIPINSTPGSTTCAATSCGVGFDCVEVPVPCLVAPCPVQAECRASNHSTGITCANVRIKCKSGQQCGMINGAPACVTACQENETFQECSFMCEPQCGKPEKLCPASCGPPKCQCNTGFWRNATGSCVVQADCNTNETGADNEKNHTLTCATVKCKNGMICGMFEAGPKCVQDSFDSCGQNEALTFYSARESTCDSPLVIEVMQNHTGRCQCSGGYVRNSEGDCVTHDQCDTIVDTDPVCEPNEVYSDCAPKCEPTCRGDGCKNANITTMECTPGCVCKPFYKRDKKGVCRHTQQCFKHAGCKANEKWSSCRTCEKTCENPDNSMCAAVCHSGCECKDGFVRNSDGDCVDETSGCSKTFAQ